MRPAGNIVGEAHLPARNLLLLVKWRIMRGMVNFYPLLINALHVLTLPLLVYLTKCSEKAFFSHLKL